MSTWRRALFCAAAPLSTYAAFSGIEDTKLGQTKPKTKDNKVKKAKAKELIRRYMLLNGVPGVSVGVTVNGKTVLRSGVGLADVEQGVKCNGDTVMRIASISKSITSVIAAQLIEEGKLDVEAPVQKYVPTFPKKEFDKQPVDITCKHLLTHTSGIRHYQKADTLAGTVETGKENDKNADIEFYLNQEFPNVTAALSMFLNDPLLSKPGTTFAYTTHGFTLLSAALEGAAGISFPALLSQLTRQLGMTKTRLDKNLEIIPNRSRYYRVDKRGKLENVPEVNNSYKWAGGGLLSNVSDLLTFANALLYSFQARENAPIKPIIKRSTLEKLWTGAVSCDKSDHKYGWGWFTLPKIPEVGGTPLNQTGFVYHTGGAVGASSVLLIDSRGQEATASGQPQGVCVAILANKQDAGTGITTLALQIAELYAED
uniref:Beta-lactamase domain-containing protein n=1 Tax=Panagrellus redivivus TaxID=6233 RepID=A0A7E4VZ13_PANRE